MGIFRRRSKHALSDILKGLQSAVNGVQDMLQTQQLQNLKKFWHESDGSPVCQKIRIGDKEIDVPLAVLVSHRRLEMENMEVKLTARVSDIKSKSIVHILDSQSDLSSPEIMTELEDIKLEDNNVLHITIQFKLKEDQEGLTHLIDQYNKNI